MQIAKVVHAANYTAWALGVLTVYTMSATAFGFIPLVALTVGGVEGVTRDILAITAGIPFSYWFLRYTSILKSPTLD